ncbi:MAG: hypothetical protein R3Y12_05365 [Clostridia bacterium]
MIRTYANLKKIKTFNERFEYLKLDGIVGVETFGFDRYLNQKFYKSSIWRKIRDEVITRDNGCDLGLEGYEMNSNIIIHHLNPINQHDVKNLSEFLINPEYLICTSMHTHNSIHYGNDKSIPMTNVVRSKNDTCPWKQ